jgi:hypothetical protein
MFAKQQHLRHAPSQSVILQLLLLHGAAAPVQARMCKDMARLEAQRQELSDRITSLQASIFKGSEKLDQVFLTSRTAAVPSRCQIVTAMTAKIILQLAASKHQLQGNRSKLPGRPRARLGTCSGHDSVDAGAPVLLQFKLLMNWNQEELDQWALAQQQKEEDNQALDKYRCGCGAALAAANKHQLWREASSRNMLHTWATAQQSHLPTCALTECLCFAPAVLAQASG